ncbi:MAG TPA: lipoyl(octanoyl) transferase, partial [Alicycliphilus sp.]|nr:lipoyl(octanoyl) transferase [Alicycliphilus sp.]
TVDLASIGVKTDWADAAAVLGRQLALRLAP